MIILIILVSSLGTITLAILCSLIVYVYFVNKKNIWGILKLNFDLENWRVKNDIFFAQRNDNLTIVSDENFKRGLWVPIDIFFNNLNTPNENKEEIRSILLLAKQEILSHTLEIEIDPQMQEHSFVRAIKSKFINRFEDKIKAKVELTSVEESHLHTYITWNNVVASYEEKEVFSFLSREEVLNIKSKFKTFIGFKFKVEDFSHWNIFQRIIQKHLWNTKISYFKEDEIIYLILFDEKRHKVRKATQRIYDLIKNSHHAPFLSSFLHSFAIVEIEKLDYIDNIESLKLRMRFALLRSVADGVPYWFTEDAKDLSIYEIFKKTNSLIKEVVLQNKTEVEIVKIKSFATGRAMGTLLTLSLEMFKNEDRSINEVMFQDKYYLDKLEKNFIESLKSKSNIPRSSFVHLSFDLFREEGQFLINGNIIPVIAIDNLFDLEEVENFILKSTRRINIAIKISTIDENVLNFLLKNYINFVFIDNKLTLTDENDKNILKLFFLREKITSKNIKFIFNLNNVYLNENQIRKIGLKYYYNYQMSL